MAPHGGEEVKKRTNIQNLYSKQTIKQTFSIINTSKSLNHRIQRGHSIPTQRRKPSPFSFSLP